MSYKADHDSPEAPTDATAEKRHDRFLLLLYLFGSVLSAVALIELAARSDYIGRPSEPEWLSIWQVVGFAILVALFIPFCVGVYALFSEAENVPKAATYALTVLLIPIVLAVGWLIFYRENHLRQAEALATFDTYYHRIPDDKLGPAFVNWHDEVEKDNVEVCADLGRQDDTDFICAVLDLGLPDGSQVIGGFEAKDVDVYDEGGYYDREYEGLRDCWGEAYLCENE